MKEILDKQPLRVVKQLLFNQDKEGRRVYDIANEPLKDVINNYLLFCGRFEVEDGYPLHISDTSVVVLANDHSIVTSYRDTFDKYKSTNGKDIGLPKDQFDAALKEIQSQLVAGDYGKEVNGAMESFSRADRNLSNIVDCEEFLDFCKNKFGETRQVILKFMKHMDQYQREMRYRIHTSPSSTIYLIDHPPIDPDRLTHSLQTFELSLGRGINLQLSAYQHCLVRPAADRNLDSVLRFESPTLGLRLGYAQDIIDRLKACHEKDLMHGDMKALNIVRLFGSLKLIDLDASGKIDVDYAGSKFSSGVLPPEMFAELSLQEVKMYSEYWENRINLSVDEGRKFWDKIKPIVSEGSRAYVVRTFASNADGTPCDRDKLPYYLIGASGEIGS